jgi:tape measure domain-containing protein
MGSLADVYVRIRGNTDTLKDDTQKGGEEAGALAGQKFGGSFVSMIRNAAATVGTLLAGRELLSLGEQGLKTAADMQQAQVAFTTLIGNASQAQKFLSDLQNFAAATPFTLPGLVDDARLLMGVGVAANQVIPTLTAWGNAAGALGVSNDRFNNAMLALSQSLGAGKINAQDMNQIINAGIPIWKLMSEATGLPVPKLRELSAQGKLLSDQILPKVEAQMNKDYGGAMAAQSKTLTGVWSTFTDTLDIGMANSLKPLIPLMSTAIPAAASVLQRGLQAGSNFVAEFIKQFGAGVQGNGPLQGFSGWMNTAGLGLRAFLDTLKTGAGGAAGFQGAMQNVALYVRDIYSASVTTWGWIRANVVPLLKDLAGALGTVIGFLLQHRTTTETLVGVMVALVAITRAHAAAMAVEAAGGLLKYLASMNLVQMATKAWTALQWLLNLAMDANPIGLVVVAIGLLVVAFVYLWNHSSAFRNFWIALWSDIWSFLKTIGAWFAGPFTNFFKAAWNDISVGALWLWHNVLDPVWQGIVNGIAFVQNIVKSFANLWLFIWQNTIGAVILWLWHNVWEPAINDIAALAMWLWNNAIKPAADGIGIALQAIGTAAMWLWHNAIMPAVHGIGDVFVWLWSNVISPVFGWISSAAQTVAGAIKSAFGAIGGFIASAFSGAVGIVRGAINGVISVINSAIGGVNSVIDSIDKVPGVSFPHIPSLPHLDIGGDVLSTGLAVIHKGERVTPAADVARLRNHPGDDVASSRDLLTEIRDLLATLRLTVDSAGLALATRAGEKQLKYAEGGR